MSSFAQSYGSAPYSFGDHGEDSPRMRLFREAERAKEIEARNAEAIAMGNELQVRKGQQQFERESQFQAEKDALDLRFEEEVVVNSPDAETLHSNTFAFIQQNPSYLRHNPEALSQGQRLIEGDIRLGASRRAASRDEKAFEWEEENAELIDTLKSQQLTAGLAAIRNAQDDRERTFAGEDMQASDALLQAGGSLDSRYDEWMSKRMTWANEGGTPAEKLERRTSLSRFVSSMGAINKTVDFATQRFQVEHRQPLQKMASEFPELMEGGSFNFELAGQIMQNSPSLPAEYLDLYQDLQALDALIETKKAADAAMGLASTEGMTPEEAQAVAERNATALTGVDVDDKERNSRLMLAAHRLNEQARIFEGRFVSREQVQEKERTLRMEALKEEKAEVDLDLLDLRIQEASNGDKELNSLLQTMARSEDIQKLFMAKKNESEEAKVARLKLLESFVASIKAARGFASSSSSASAPVGGSADAAFATR